MAGCPIRKSADRIVCANPRSLSQLITSFIASQSQGIHHALLFASYCLCEISHFYRLDFIYLNSYVKEHLNLVENIGLEPMTSCVQDRRSSQLS